MRWLVEFLRSDLEGDGSTRKRGGIRNAVPGTVSTRPKGKAGKKALPPRQAKEIKERDE